MNQLKITLVVLALLITGLFVNTTKTDAHGCQLVDPVNGVINITCSDANLTLNGDGVRSLPLPNSVPLRTELRVVWAQPVGGNVILQSWDSANQTSHFWERIGGTWVNNPANAYLETTGASPWVELEVKRMPNGQRGWAIIEKNDLVLTNGGN